jgi:hypothetical protein
MPQARPDRVPAAGEPGGLSGRDQVTVALLGEIRVDEHWLSPLGFWPDVPWVTASDCAVRASLRQGSDDLFCVATGGGVR